MTKLNATEIKAIIEEKGSNIIETFVEVRNDIFRNDTQTQSKIISSELFGVDNASICYFVYSGYTSSQKIVIQVRVEITEEFLNNLSTIESNTAISVINPSETSYSNELDYVSSPLSFEELLERSNSNRNRFIVSIPSSSLFSENELKNIVLNLISRAVTFHSVQTSVLPQVRNDNGTVDIEVVISDLQTAVNRHNENQTEINEVYASLEIESRIRHISPLTLSDLRAARERNSAFDEGYVFSRLMEFDYEELLDNGHLGIQSKIASDYTDFCEVDDFEHRAVGFNPITEKVIILVEGYVSFEYLEA